MSKKLVIELSEKANDAYKSLAKKEKRSKLSYIEILLEANANKEIKKGGL